MDDDKKFAVALDVSQFHPEELKVHLDGRELTIEGKQQHRSDTSFLERYCLHISANPIPGVFLEKRKRKAGTEGL